MSDESQAGALTPEELAAEAGTALPAKEVMSLLDLNANLDLAIDDASPIGLAVGANANIAAPIEAAVGANVLSPGSTDIADAEQAAGIHQGLTGDANATVHQTSGLDQTGSGQTDPTQTAAPAATTTPTTDSSTGNLLDGNLLNINVDLNGDLKLAAPIDGAVAANANAAAPIDAAVSANIGSPDSQAEAIAHQDAVIDQTIDGNATATGDQQSTINQ
jgi:hypothetical protein